MNRVGFLLILSLVLGACSSSDVKDAADAISAAQGVPRKRIDIARTGVNAFANEPGFGSACKQYADIQGTLGLKFVRVLFNWNDDVQPSPGAEPNFAFYDQIVSCVPKGMDALVVVNGLPSWMQDPANWADPSPRVSFVEMWARKVMRRYRNESAVIGWQIWNEPNMTENSENVFLGLDQKPVNYIEMLARAFSVSRDVAPTKLVVGAATTAINQNYPRSLSYNRGMQEAGADKFLDVWAIHYYGGQYENVVRPDGIDKFLNGLKLPLWVTESGAVGVDNQLEYVERTWPFLDENIDGIERFYYYEYASTANPDATYGMCTTDPQLQYSDLYTYLKDQNAGQ